jgi:hypothetical protein
MSILLAREELSVSTNAVDRVESYAVPLSRVVPLLISIEISRLIW